MKKMTLLVVLSVVVFTGCNLYFNNYKKSDMNDLNTYINKEFDRILSEEEEYYKILLDIREPKYVGPKLSQFLSYQRDTSDEEGWQTISEALLSGKGDCEEFTWIAACLLYKIFNVESYVVFGYNKYHNEGNIDHVYLDSFIDGEWITWEPQAGLDYNPEKNSMYKRDYTMHIIDVYNVYY